MLLANVFSFFILVGLTQEAPVVAQGPQLKSDKTVKEAKLEFDFIKTQFNLAEVSHDQIDSRQVTLKAVLKKINENKEFNELLKKFVKTRDSLKNIDSKEYEKTTEIIEDIALKMSDITEDIFSFGLKSLCATRKINKKIMVSDGEFEEYEDEVCIPLKKALPAVGISERYFILDNNFLNGETVKVQLCDNIVISSSKQKEMKFDETIYAGDILLSRCLVADLETPATEQKIERRLNFNVKNNIIVECFGPSGVTFGSFEDFLTYRSRGGSETKEGQ